LNEFRMMLILILFGGRHSTRVFSETDMDAAIIPVRHPTMPSQFQ
jgi:hypothetical protein